MLNPEHIAAYHRDGYTIARAFFTPEETGLLRRAALEDNQIDRRAFGRDDGEGGRVRLAVWNQPGDSLYGMVARCARVVDSMEALLGGEVYHYHSKMILKEPRVGGAWAWHQDYGYWYHNGCLYPQMASVYIAVDPATRQNGCMQLLKGSHHMGRVEHTLVGEQTGADADVIHGRLPEIARDGGLPSGGVILARGLAPLPKLLDIVFPVISPATCCIFLKGAGADAEISDARSRWRFDLDKIQSCTSPDGVLLKLTGICHDGTAHR